MKKLALFGLLALILSVSVVSAQDYSRFAGHFEGELSSGEDMIPVTTTISLLKSGDLAGAYIMTEEDAEVPGRLTFESEEGPNVLVFSWKDKYGEGIVRLLFSSDGASFVGFWGEGEDETNESWNGHRQ